MTTKVTTVRSSLRFSLLGAVVFLLTALSSHAQEEIFLKSYWLNFTTTNAEFDAATNAASIWAGGNESPTTNGSQSGFCLAESAIGQMTAESAGYPGAQSDLLNTAAASAFNGQSYRYSSGLPGNGPQTNPAVAWNVVFSGGFNPSAGVSSGQYTYPSGVASTYISSDIGQADYALRAALEVDPDDTNAAHQLVLLVEDQILPLEWSGNEAIAYSAYARNLPGPVTWNGTNVETIAVEDARGYFRSACNVFFQFLANPYNALLIEGQDPFFSTNAVSGQTAQVVEDYLRNVDNYAQASMTDFQLRELANFYDPTQSGSTPSQPLLNDIDNTVGQIQLMLLLASPFQSLSNWTTLSIGQTKSILHDMRRLHQSIMQGRIDFSAGASGDPTGDPSLDYGEFTTAFVPFFPGFANPGNSSFDVALSLAQTFAAYAQVQEAAASSNIVAVLQRQYDWTSDQVNLQNQYLPQLQNLCGYVVDSNNNQFPDVFTAALSPDVRNAVIAELSSNGFQFNETGTIYSEWLAVGTAETNLLLAYLDLTNTLAEMVEKTQVADAIYSNQINLAELILTNGQQIAAIDVQEGQVQAAADEEIAQIEATEAKKNANNSLFGGIVSGIASGIESAITAGTASQGASSGAGAGSASAVNSFASTAVTVANDYDQAAADLQIGQVQANEATQLAALNAQIEQLNAEEQAQAEYVQADTTMLDLSADLFSLQQQAQAQEVQIQLAAQNVDQERSKLANMMSQVSSLLNQWTRSASLVQNNPEFSSNLLVVQDATIQQANDAFTLAQEWAFLTALCFNYKDNCPETSSYGFVQRVLAARNTSTLIPILNEMNSAETLITAGCESSPYYSTVQFSLRNNSLQANQTQENGVVVSYEPVQLVQGGTVFTNAAASYTLWTNYLASNVITNEFGERVMVLNFSTALGSQTVGGVQRNPLFSCYAFGTTLYSGSDNNGNQLHGVQVSLNTQGFTFPNGEDETFNVLLAQTGVSSIRNRGFGNTTVSAAGFRYFNFGYFAAAISASANNLQGNGGTAALEDRSPANSLWQLSINETDSANNAALLDNLGKLTDIQLQFSIRSYVDQVAAQACTSQ